MGVPKINNYLKKLDSLSDVKGINNSNLSDIGGNTIAIDTFTYIYKALYNNGDDYLIYILGLVNKFKKFDIRPIFVFDGNPPKEKDATILSRKQIKNKNKHKIKELKTSIEKIKKLKTVENNSNDNQEIIAEKDNKINEEHIEKSEKEIQKLNKRCITVKKIHIDEVKCIFDSIGVEYIHLNHEADIVCSELVKQGYAHAVLSNDMDLLAYNCPVIIRNLNLKDNSMMIYDMSKILKNVALTSGQITQLIVMLGCDYSRSLGVPCEDLYKLIKEYSSNIDEILDHILENGLSKCKNMLEKNSYKKQYLKSISLFNVAIPIETSHISNYKQNIENNGNLYNENLYNGKFENMETPYDKLQTEKYNNFEIEDPYLSECNNIINNNIINWEIIKYRKSDKKKNILVECKT